MKEINLKKCRTLRLQCALPLPHSTRVQVRHDRPGQHRRLKNISERKSELRVETSGSRVDDRNDCIFLAKVFYNVSSSLGSRGFAKEDPRKPRFIGSCNLYMLPLFLSIIEGGGEEARRSGASLRPPIQIFTLSLS